MAVPATVAPIPAPSMLDTAPVSPPQQQQQQQQQVPPRPSSAAAKLVKSGLLKRIWKAAPATPSPLPKRSSQSKTAPNTPKPSQSSKTQPPSEKTSAKATGSTASSPKKDDDVSQREKQTLTTSPPSQPPPALPPQNLNQPEPCSPKKVTAPLSFFRSPTRSGTVPSEQASASAAPAPAPSIASISPPRPDIAALSKPNGKYRVHDRSTSSSSFARAPAGVGLDAAEPFEQQVSPTVDDPFESHSASNGPPISPQRTRSLLSQKSEKEQRQMLAVGSTAAAQAFAEQVITGLGPPSPPAVTNAALPVIAHTSPKDGSAALKQPLNAPPVDLDEPVRVQDASLVSPPPNLAVQPTSSGLLSAASVTEKQPDSRPQSSTIAPSLSSRTDEVPTPTTDSGSHILSGAPSLTTSAATSPAQLTPASSAGEGNGVLARSHAIENGKMGTNLAASSTLAVPAPPEKKRRSFLGIRLGSSKSLKTPTPASPVTGPQSPAKVQAAAASNHSSASLAAEADDHVPEVPALPKNIAAHDPHVSRSRSTRQTTTSLHALLPGQRIPGPRQPGSPNSGNRMSHPPPVTYKSFPSQPVAISKGSTTSLGQHSTSSRRRYKDTRDLSALVNELAAEEAHAAHQYQKQQAMLQQQHSFSSAGADLSSTFSHQSKSLHVPRPAASPYQSHGNPSTLSTATASRNASQTSLNVVPLNAGLQASATNSPVLPTSELNAIGQSDAVPINGKRPSSREIQSSASSVASHPGQLSSSLPTSPHQSMRIRTHTQEGSNWDAASSYSQRSGISTPSHHMSAASAAFRNRAAAMGFSALDAGLTGAQSLIVDPFGFPMASDSPFDASKAYRSPNFSNGSDDGTRGFGSSQADLGMNASTSSFHGVSDTVSIDGGHAPTSASHGSSGGQRVRRTMLTMSLYDPETDKQGLPTPPSGRTREASTESGGGGGGAKTGGKSGERSGSRLSSPFGSRGPSRSVTPKTSSRALDEAVKQEEKLRIKEEKRRAKEEKKQELQNAKRLKQWQDEMNMVPRDPKASKATREELAAREAEKEKQKALAKGVDEALRRAQEAQGIALQEQYKRQQALLQKPQDGSSSRNSRRNSPQSSIRPSSQLEAIITAGDQEVKETSPSPQPQPPASVPAPAPDTDVAIPKSEPAVQDQKVSVSRVNGAVAPAAEGVPATSRTPSLSPGRPPRAPARAASSTNIREAAA
ncbi:hypothetical protein OC846_005492 [Tilletia horrida]|uniref:Uncharacterized protein n=1 Tax=Tilletia horrida TaxID=155126 RepID=A0AAN6GMV9_9BASI|nr:hypothetical protein OC846_005492 [Tilletia horrida]KAK0549495.1 hypothetical protein OC845_003114 [Tilletia horrida]KAK0561759.1 hypothetical protein OC861_005665 [Tilletia horrida]